MDFESISNFAAARQQTRSVVLNYQSDARRFAESITAELDPQERFDHLWEATSDAFFGNKHSQGTVEIQGKTESGLLVTGRISRKAQKPPQASLRPYIRTIEVKWSDKESQIGQVESLSEPAGDFNPADHSSQVSLNLLEESFAAAQILLEDTSTRIVFEGEGLLGFDELEQRVSLLQLG